MKSASSLIGLIFLTFVIGTGGVYASDAELVDIAGSQRMLTQRILKSYCQVGLNEVYGNPAGQLQDAVTRFESQIVTIEKGSSNERVKRTLAKVKQLWPEYKALASETPTKQGAAKLLALNPELLAAAHAVVVALEETSGVKAGEIVNLSGRQRMLSQRMAMFYMLQLWGVEDASIATGLEKANKEFSQAHKRLSLQRSNTPDIKKGLNSVSKHLKLLERTMQYKDQNLSFSVAMTTEGMLAEMNKVTAAYASLPAQ